MVKIKWLMYFQQFVSARFDLLPAQSQPHVYMKEPTDSHLEDIVS